MILLTNQMIVLKGESAMIPRTDQMREKPVVHRSFHLCVPAAIFQYTCRRELSLRLCRHTKATDKELVTTTGQSTENSPVGADELDTLRPGDKRQRASSSEVLDGRHQLRQ